jgi:hypothetical protein
MRFDQGRKDAAGEVVDQVRTCLTDFYDVPDRRVASVESIHEGKYREDGGGYSAAHLIDFAGLDWVVNPGSTTVGVAERVRPVNPELDTTVDFSLRVDNGSKGPCKSTRMLESGDSGGLWPREILFGRRDGDNLRRAWMLDTETVISGCQDGSIPREVHGAGDGTAAAYIELIDLVNAGAVIEGWENPDPQPESRDEHLGL